MEKFSRLRLLLTDQQFTKLQNANILVFGLGGVGGYVVEGLVRSGIGNLTLVDYDEVSSSDFNRQIIAVEENVNAKKTAAFFQRIQTINESCQVKLDSRFIRPTDIGELNFRSYDYVVDAIDTVSTKLAIIQKAKDGQVPAISALGFGNKLDPSKITIGDISETKICPLAKVLRSELRKLGINNVTVAYSSEQPLRVREKLFSANRKAVVGSFAPVVAVAGFQIAAYVIHQIIDEQ